MEIGYDGPSLPMLIDTEHTYRIQVFEKGQWRTFETKEEYQNLLAAWRTPPMSLSEDEARLVLELLRREERRYDDNSIPYVTQATQRELAVIKLRVALEKKLK